MVLGDERLTFVANATLFTQEQIGVFSVHDLGGLLIVRKHANIPTFI